MFENLPGWAKELGPIAILLAIISFVIWRLPKVDVGHTDAFKRRRFLNWFPLGLTYAFLYMGRYNLNAAKYSKSGLIDEAGFGKIFAVGALVYGVSFILNGPLTDRYGGRKTILAAALGSALSNLLMAVAASVDALKPHAVLVFSVLYGVNMYFQSFGAVSIVKVNAAWFHVRERGTFGGVFGILISLGIYFAYDWGRAINTRFDLLGLFTIPAAILLVFCAFCWLFVYDAPSEVGLRDFDAGDASSGDTGPQLPVAQVARRLFANPVILIIIAIEFCSGFLRNAIMQWYLDFANGMGVKDSFVPKNWGMVLCVAGIMGGTFAGIVSDHLFQSRRAPVVSFLYGIAIVGSIAVFAFLGTAGAVGWIVVAMNLAIIGVHGMLSGTASADFGGKKNAGVAVGIIDGFVYIGTSLQSVIFGLALPSKKHFANPADYKVAAAKIENWTVWPALMFPVALAGFVLALRIWNAKPKAHSAPALADPAGEAARGAASAKPRRGSRATQPKILEQALEAARAAGSSGVVAFDLDSTLLDNRTRQAAIIREWAATDGALREAEKVQANHLDGWDLRVALVNAGIDAQKAEDAYGALKAYWRSKFFTSEYCKLDEPTPGAVDFMNEIVKTGVKITYVTGRHEEMRAGSVECFQKVGFPVPDGANVQLIMKPTLQEPDDDFKKRTYEQLRALAKVVAAFDNEPTHVNGYKEHFPDAFVVHLDTDSSGRPVEVLASIPSVLDFARA